MLSISGKRGIKRAYIAIALTTSFLLAGIFLASPAQAVRPEHNTRLVASVSAGPQHYLSLHAEWHKPAYIPRYYEVKSGQDLSVIAGQVYAGHANCWPKIFYSNKHIIGSDPNIISPGMQLKIPPAPPGWKCKPYNPPAVVNSGSQPLPVITGGNYGSPPSWFTSCVIQRESGGDPTAYNASSGASGLFGDLLSTWLSLNLGYPGGAYTAPPSVQYQGFYKLYAEDGMSPWDADGCPYLAGAGSGGGTVLTAFITPLRGSQRHAKRIPARLRAYAWAERQHGKAYCWGGTGPDCFDCSGLVMRAYDHVGIHLPRTAEDMMLSALVKPVSKPLKGDLIFYVSGGYAYHVELFQQGSEAYGISFAAHDPASGVGWGNFSAQWSILEFFKVI